MNEKSSTQIKSPLKSNQFKPLLKSPSSNGLSLLASAYDESDSQDEDEPPTKKSNKGKADYNPEKHEMKSIDENLSKKPESGSKVDGKIPDDVSESWYEDY